MSGFPAAARSVIFGALCWLLPSMALGQTPTFAGNSQHTSLYSAVTAQPLNQIKWQTPIELNTNGAFAHYGMPLTTAANTVIVPVKTATDSFQIEAFDGATGTLKYTLTSDFTLPSFNWVPVYQPCLAAGPNGARLWYVGNGGTLYFVDNVDSNTPSAPVQVAFYGLANYTSNQSAFNQSVFLDTPITADASGDVFFGFRTQGTAPSPINSTQSGYARIDTSGNGRFVLVGNAAGDSLISRDSHNAAPALSNDGKTLYAVCKWSTNAYYGYLLALDSTTLATKSRVFLHDPRNNNQNNAGILDDSTASPMVAPDGEVFMGVFENPYNGSRGYLLHFSADLSAERTPGAFGWDNTPGIVPASMVPSYNGPSSYLLFCKYNNYSSGLAGGDGDGINRVAILDPNTTQIDFHANAGGLVEMRQVMSVIGVTPNAEEPTNPLGVREWCINAPAINPQTGNVYFDSEDGHLYSWNLASNSLTQAMVLTPGIGEPYVPSTIGPDGTVYTLNGTFLFALGNSSNADISLASSAPSLQTVVAGDTVTFTAAVSALSGTPTGTVTFTDVHYEDFQQFSSQLGTVALDPSGHAALSTSALVAGPDTNGLNLGNHWITAAYNGDQTYSPVSTTLVQKIHQHGSTTTIQSSNQNSNFGDLVGFTVTVASNDQTTDTPLGMVTIYDGQTVLSQQEVAGGSTVAFSTSTLTGGNHTISASFQGDTLFAASTGSLVENVNGGATLALASSLNPSEVTQSVTFTATASAGNPAAGVPTGSVTFTIDGNVSAVVAVDGSGRATLTTNTLAAGNHDVAASFAGSNGWNNATATDVTQVVNNGTSTALTSSLNPANFGQTVMFTATVSAVGSAIKPTGSVTFTDGGTPIATVAVAANGTATFTSSTLAAGAHDIGAAFTGSNGWGNSVATDLSQVISAKTYTTFSVSPQTLQFGTTVTFTAIAHSSDGGGGVPTGPIAFMDGSTRLATVPVDGAGQATYTNSTLTVGAHRVGASFIGTNGYQNSSSPRLTLRVKGASTTALSSIPNPAGRGRTVTFTATVSPVLLGAGTPSGWVVFKDGRTMLGKVRLDVNGQATLAISTLSLGTHTISATFTGTDFWTKSSATMSQIINGG